MPRAGRSRGVRRALGRGWPARVAAAAVMLGSSGALYAVTADPAFGLSGTPVVEGAHHTDPAIVRRMVATRDNVFRVRTDELVAPIRALPAVLRAEVSVSLPDRLVVRIEERQPILVWQAGDARFLVDVEGVLFAEAPAGARSAAGRTLPTVTDKRETDPPRTVGDRLDAVEIAAVRQLGAVTPDALGSAASSLTLAVDAEDGFTLVARPERWRAVFGHYTPHLRPSELVAEQLRCLAALLDGREDEVGTVYLSPAGERCGTYTARVDRG